MISCEMEKFLDIEEILATGDVIPITGEREGVLSNEDKRELKQTGKEGRLAERQ